MLLERILPCNIRKKNLLGTSTLNPFSTLLMYDLCENVINLLDLFYKFLFMENFIETYKLQHRNTIPNGQFITIEDQEYHYTFTNLLIWFELVLVFYPVQLVQLGFFENSNFPLEYWLVPSWTSWPNLVFKTLRSSIDHLIWFLCYWVSKCWTIGHYLFHFMVNIIFEKEQLLCWNKNENLILSMK